MADISIIIPCYNVAPYINRCLTTITSQTFGVKNLEIICVDDASTDDTFKYLQEWEKKYPENIILIHCDENKRQGAARNIGLQYSSAEWISFIDSDDWIELDYFEKMYQIASSEEYDVVMCQCERDFSTSMSFLDNRRTEKENRSMLIDTIEKRKIFLNLQVMGLASWGKLIRKEILTENNIFFPENLTYEDCYWSPLLHFYIKKIYIIEEKLYHYFINSQSTVLHKDTTHHVDCLTVNCIKWREWGHRGFLKDYREELEYEFICTCCLIFLKIIFLRFSDPPYSYYLLLKELVNNIIPDCRTNKYIEQGLDKFYQTLLESLSLTLNKDEFQELVKIAQTYWNL